MKTKKRVNITISQETQDRLIQYGLENHIPGGLSGALEYIAWHQVKVKNAQVRGQLTAEELAKRG